MRIAVSIAEEGVESVAVQAAQDATLSRNSPLPSLALTCRVSSAGRFFLTRMNGILPRKADTSTDVKGCPDKKRAVTQKGKASFWCSFQGICAVLSIATG